MVSAFLFLGGGCAKDEVNWLEEDVPSIYIEAAASTPASAKSRITMPVSEIQFQVLNSPLVPGGNFLDVNVGYAEVEGVPGPFILARIDDRGARAIRIQAMQARGQRLILVIQDKPVGVIQLSANMDPQNIFFHPEIESTDKADFDAKLLELQRNVRSTILKIREHKEDTK